MRLLFVRLSSFGDVVFALPAAKALRDSGAGTALTWVIEPGLAPLLSGAPYIDEILGADTRGWRRALLAGSTRREVGSLLARLRKRPFDVVVDAQGLLKSALVTAAAPAGRKVGFGWRTATERVNCLVTTERVEADGRPHVLDRMLALAEHVTGRSGFDRVPDVRHLVDRPDREVDAWLARQGSRPFALLQPFSSRREKEWRAEELVPAAERLSQSGLDPVLRWGPGEEVRARELRDLSKGVLLMAPATTPASSARLASRARLFIGADTGPTHLAAAAGTPTLALFGPTDAARFGPVGPRSAVLASRPGDYNSGRGLGASLDAVLDQVDRLLG